MSETTEYKRYNANDPLNPEILSYSGQIASDEVRAGEVTLDASACGVDSDNVQDAFCETSLKIVNTATDVNPAVKNTAYYIDSSSSVVTVYLPDVSEDTDGEIFRIYKVENSNDVIITTVGGTQEIGDSVQQVLVEKDTGISVQANLACSCYEIIQDSRNVAPSASINYYATNVDSDVATYKKHVTSTTDSDYNTVAVDAQNTITSTAQLLGSFISEAGSIQGIIPETSITTTGNIRRDSGNGTAQFYVEYYRRESDGTEHLLGTSSKTPNVTGALYQEFTASGIILTSTFAETDRFVTKLYADRTGVGTDPVYSVQLGGTAPARSVVPIPAGSIPIGTGTGGLTATEITSNTTVEDGILYILNSTSTLELTLPATFSQGFTFGIVTKNVGGYILKSGASGHEIKGYGYSSLTAPSSGYPLIRKTAQYRYDTFVSIVDDTTFNHTNYNTYEGLTDYNNTGGSGDRLSIIIGSSNVTWNTGNITKLYDGINGNDVYFTNESTTGLYMRFKFPEDVIIDEATWKEDSASAHGTWKWQISNDGASWEDVGSPFILGGAPQVQTELNGNTKRAIYYQLLGISGNTNSGPFLYEIEFKISR